MYAIEVKARVTVKGEGEVKATVKACLMHVYVNVVCFKKNS